MKSQTTDKLLPLKTEDYARDRMLPLDYLADVWKVSDLFDNNGVLCMNQPYIRLDGTRAAPRRRYANAKMSEYGSGESMTLYGQKQMMEQWTEHHGNDNPPYVILVEGESDTHAIHFAGWPVLGVPGTQSWNKCMANDPAILKFLEGRERIFVIQEPPSPGEKKKHADTSAKMVKDIRASLPNVKVHAVNLWELAPKDEKEEPLYKDSSGLWIFYGGDRKRVWLALNRAVLHGLTKGRAPQWELKSFRASEREPEAQEWLWLGHIPVSDTTVFTGMAGQGKGTVLVDFVARLSKGQDMPDNSPKQVDACEVAWFSAEDSLQQTIIPRLMAAKAYRSNVHLMERLELVGNPEVSRGVNLGEDLPLLKKWLAQFPATKLLVFDPINSYTGPINPNHADKVRPFLEKLATFAREMDIGLIIVMHFSKNPDVSPIHRSGGAVEWINVPRASWFFDEQKTPEDEPTPEVKTYLMMPGKINNVSEALKKSLTYTFGSVGVKCRKKDGTYKDDSFPVIEWRGESEIGIKQHFAKPSTGKKGPQTDKKGDTTAWLKQHMERGEWMKGVDVLKAGMAAGFKEDMVKQVSVEIGVEKEKRKDGSWWVLQQVVFQPEVDAVY
jgi:hypothetical protein